MKVFLFFVFVFGIITNVNGQKEEERGFLKGVVYDQIGQIIKNAKVIATSLDGKKFETVTDENGKYQLELPVTVYKGNYDIRNSPITKYLIQVKLTGFKVTEIKEFNFVQTTSKEMQLDLALEVGIIGDTILKKKKSLRMRKKQ